MTISHPWQYSYQDLVDAATTYYNITIPSQQWQDYISTNVAFYQNSFAVPMFASYAILGLFAVLVFLLAITHTCQQHVQLYNRACEQNTFLRFVRDNFINAPLFGLRRAEPVNLLGKYLTLQLPLRGDTFVLFGLFICNLIPILAFYTPFRQDNLFWPSSSYEEVLRYVSDRSGVIATMQLPPLFILAGRNNPVTWLTGASFERCMLYHRWFARFVFAHVVIHAIGYSLIAAANGGTEGYRSYWVDPYLRWGGAATVAFGLLIFLSLRYLRQIAYEVFVIIHVVMAIIALVGTFYHIELLQQTTYSDFIYAIYASVAFYCLDKVARIAKTLHLSFALQRGGARLNVATDTVTVLCEGKRGTILRHKVSLPQWKATKAAECTFVQLNLPRLQPLASHPFTIANIEQDETSHRSSLILYTKVHKGITRKLYSRIKRSTNTVQQTQHVAMVEGFYGEAPPIARHSAVVMIAGGIGITVCMPLFQRAASAHDERNLQHVDLHWIIPEPSMLYVLIDLLKQTKKSVGGKEEDSASESQLTKTRNIIVHITLNDLDQGEDQDAMNTVSHLHNDLSSSARDASDSLDEEAIKEEAKAIPQSPSASMASIMSLRNEAQRLAALNSINLTFDGTHGRPDIHEITQSTKNQVSHIADATTNMAIVSCGPATLCDSARLAARKNGMTYYEEAFEW